MSGRLHPPIREEAAGGLIAIRSIILICGLVYFLDGLIHAVMGPLAPDIARGLKLSPAELGPIFSANLLGQCLGLVAFPLLTGRFGHRRVVILCVVGFGIFQGLTGLARDAGELFAIRLATGVFLGGCLPSCLAIVTAAAPIQRRGLAITMLFTGYGLGSTVAGIIATAFASWGGWRGASFAIGATCLLSAVIAWRWLSEAPRTEASRTGLDRNPLAVVSPRYLVGTLMLWLLFVSMLTISYCLNSWLPTLLVQVGREAWMARMSVSIFSLGGIIAALGVGLLIDRWGATRVLVTFLMVSTALLFATGQVLASAPAPLLLVLLAVCGFFVLGAYGGVNVVLAGYYPDSLRAVGIGWTKSVGRIGTIVAPILIGLGLSAGAPETQIMSLFAVPAALSALALVVIARATAGVRASELTGAIAIGR